MFIKTIVVRGGLRIHKPSRLFTCSQRWCKAMALGATLSAEHHQRLLNLARAQHVETRAQKEQCYGIFQEKAWVAQELCSYGPLRFKLYIQDRSFGNLLQLGEFLKLTIKNLIIYLPCVSSGMAEAFGAADWERGGENTDRTGSPGAKWIWRSQQSTYSTKICQL